MPRREHGRAKFSYDGLETESLHCGNSLEEWKCIAFIRRFPLYLSLFNVIYRDIKRSVEDMHHTIDQAFELTKELQEKAETD